jgi:hypothetical protein
MLRDVLDLRISSGGSMTVSTIGELRGCRKYDIRSDLLYELLTYGDGLSSKYGFTNWNIDHGPARPMLTLIAMRAFDVYRLPWHHDRCFCRHIFDDRAKQALKSVSLSAITEAVRDAQALHEHTYRTLSSLGLRSVRLNRSLFNEGSDKWGSATQVGYASHVSQVDDAALRLGRRSFRLPMDILSSWCVGPYSKWQVVLEHEIPIENVAWCSALIGSRDPALPDRSALEGGEWIMLNRTIDGCVELPAGCVAQRPDNERSDRRGQWHAQGSMDDLAALLDKKAPDFEPMSSTRHQYMWPAPQQLSLATRLRRSWDLLYNRRVV